MLLITWDTQLSQRLSIHCEVYDISILSLHFRQQIVTSANIKRYIIKLRTSSDKCKITDLAEASKISNRLQNAKLPISTKMQIGKILLGPHALNLS